MPVHETDGRAVEAGSDRPYGRLGLTELAERIVRTGDREALRELHDRRTPFSLRDGPAMSLLGFLAASSSRTSAWRRAGCNELLLERARDLTVDKFAHLPRDTTGDGVLKSSGPDCRYYFRAFVRHMRRWRRDNQDATPMEEELAAARALQRLVLQQFHRSCQEAKRALNPARGRYTWRVDGGELCVWMPTAMTGGERRRWLEANVDDPDPSRSGERQLVQSIIDRHLGFPRHVPLDEAALGVQSGRSCIAPPDSSTGEESRLPRLAEFVAEEKAERIGEQRPAIRALGPSSLRQLILRILGDLGASRYQEKAIAAAFGLSRPTLSRFAGSRWRSSPSTRVPDLWLNMAHVLAGRAAFVEAAQEAGVWDRVEQLVHESGHTEAGER